MFFKYLNVLFSLVFLSSIFYFIITGFFSSSENAISLLEKQGYSNIRITGYKFFSCSKEDIFKTGFKAEKDGKEFSGTVCSGILKGKTIRFN